MQVMRMMKLIYGVQLASYSEQMKTMKMKIMKLKINKSLDIWKAYKKHSIAG